jgi:hypothetical protein
MLRRTKRGNMLQFERILARRDFTKASFARHAHAA